MGGLKTRATAMFLGIVAACGGGTGATAPGDGGLDAAESGPVQDATGGRPDGSPTDAAAPDAPPDAGDSAAPVDAGTDAALSTVLVQGRQPTGIAVDSTGIYWADWMAPPSGASAIMHASLDGSQPAVLVADSATVVFPSDVVLFGGYVYWDDYGSSSAGLPAVGRCPETGCAAGQALPYVADFTYGSGLAASDAGIFWVGSVGPDITKALWRVDPSEAGASGVIAGDMWGAGTVVLDGTPLVYVGMTSGSADQVGVLPPTAPLVDADAAMPPPVLATLTSVSNPPWTGPTLAVDATTVFYLDPTTGVLGAVPKTGLPDGGSPQVLASGLVNPMRIVADDTGLYFTVNGPQVITGGNMITYPEGAIMTCPKAGCGASGPTVLAGSLDGLSGFLALDATSVYFTCTGDGTVRRVAK